jgi:hypothetical protein
MKKFVVLTLVLAMASLATAGLTVTGTNEAKMDGGTGGYAVYIVWTDAPIDATITLTTGWAGDQSYANGMGPYPGSALGWTALGTIDVTFVNIASSTSGAMTAGNHATITVGGGLELGDTDYGLGRIDVLASSLAANLGTVYIIPEPMTMGLLGLGALFLRRKK